jgi:membrane protease YdiL (CAAX protease family)
MSGALLALALIAYNAVANRWRAFHGWAYVPANLLTTGAVLWVASGALHLDRAEIGLRWEGAALGLGLGASIAAFPIAALIHPRTRALVADRRFEGVRGWTALYYLVARIPLGTAVLEEVAFRGALFGALSSHGSLQAALASSIAFGLWHVVPTIDLVRANRPGTGTRAIAIALVGAVAFAAVAGLGLGWLRVETGSILAGLVAHALINAGGAVAAMIALRLT